MTPAQAKLLTFIIQHGDETGISPSFSEMMVAMGMKSKAGIHEHMRHLVRDGWIEYSGVRNISVLKRPLWLSPYGSPALEKLTTEEVQAVAGRIVAILDARRLAA